MTVPSRWAANAGVRLHYLDSGGHGPAVVFVPGFGEEALDHLDLIETLAGFRVIVPDLRGRGPSDAPATDYDLRAHIADLEAVVGHAQLSHRLHLASYSRGTAYALGWAVANADRLASITVAEYPAAQLVPPREAATMLAERERFGRPITDRIALGVIARIFATATAELYYDGLAAITAPLLVVHGTRASTLVSDEALAAYRSARPDAVIEAWDDCGHDLWRPDPTRFAQRLRAFVEAPTI